MHEVTDKICLQTSLGEFIMPVCRINATEQLFNMQAVENQKTYIHKVYSIKKCALHALFLQFNARLTAPYGLLASSW